MMLEPPLREMIHSLHQKGKSQHEISRVLSISRTTVRKILKEGPEPSNRLNTQPEDWITLIKQLFQRVSGNVVRVHELLRENYQKEIPYSTLTYWIRHYGIRGPKRRSGSYHFEPGVEMQHDTSPHRVSIDGKTVTAQCASLVLSYSRRLYIRYYPRFTRFEAKTFLQSALQFMDGACQRCVIDNTSVVLASGSGADAIIAPDMQAFARLLGFTFFAHAIGHANRKARVERPFHYIEHNFLAGRTFTSWNDLNQRAEQWCRQVANAKPKRVLGMTPEAAFIQEKPSLKPLPELLPPLYEVYQRQVDSQGFVNVDTNRYSVPESLIGQSLCVHKTIDAIIIYHQHRKIAEHARLLDKRYTRQVNKSHHPSLHRQEKRKAATEAEQLLTHQFDTLDQYIAELKKRVRGRGQRTFNRLLHLKRTYPADAFEAAIQQAHHYGLYDLTRLEDLIIQWVAGEYFTLNKEGKSS